MACQVFSFVTSAIHAQIHRVCNWGGLTGGVVAYKLAGTGTADAKDPKEAVTKGAMYADIYKSVWFYFLCINYLVT